MLNAVSGPTVHALEYILFDRTLLNLRKLTDPFNSRRASVRSVTIKGLPKYFLDNNRELKKLISHADRSAGFARNWSDKRIAHSDLDYQLGAVKLETASRQKVEEALDAVAHVIKWVAREHYDTTLVTHPIPPLDDERLLLRAIFLGWQEIQSRKSLEQKLRNERRYEELDIAYREHGVFPEWLRRDDPPMDIE